MSIYKKLMDLNQDIEILENYQDFKAANILHKKFIREAQSLTPNRNTGFSGPYKQVFDKYFNLASTTPSQSLINTIRTDGFLLKEDQDQLIKYVTERLQSITPTPATQAPKNTTTPIATPSPTPTVTPTVTPTATPTATPQAVSQTPLVSIPVNNQQKSAPQTLSDTANYNAAMEPFYSGANQVSPQQNTMPNQKVNEQQLYMNSLNEIIELFKTKRPEAINAAEQIYVNTYTQLTNQSSKTLFARQIQRLRNQYNIARLKGQR